MKKIVLLISFIFALSMLLGGCFQPLFNGSQWDSIEDSDDAWTDDAWTDDEDLEEWFNEEEASAFGTELIPSIKEDAYADQPETSQDSDSAAGHDPECDAQFHGPDFCGNYAEISYIDIDRYNASVEISVDLYYHCFFALIISDVNGNPVAVLANMEEYPGDPNYATVLPGEVPPNIPFDAQTETADMYEYGPQNDTYYYQWNGLHGQTDEPALPNVDYTANLYIYFSEDGAIDLPAAIDYQSFFFDPLYADPGLNG